MSRNLNSKEKPTTPRLPDGAAWGTRVLALVLLLFFSVGFAFGQSSKLSKDLQSLPSGATTNVIVQYYSPPGKTDSNAASSVGATNGRALGLIKGTRYGMTAAAAQKLVSLDANVKYISPDRPLRGALNLAASAVAADVAHSWGWDGTGIGVAVIDSGVNAVTDLGVPGSKNSSRI